MKRRTMMLRSVCSTGKTMVVTIPSEFVDDLDWKSGDAMLLTMAGGRIVIEKADADVELGLHKINDGSEFVQPRVPILKELSR